MDSFFIIVNEWITSGTTLAAAGCFLWGMISVVFSPCHLASIPLIVAYVGGQEKILKPREAGFYSVAFTSGLFITIALIGIICALLGRMLGDVGNYWQILIGLVLVWVALGMLGVEKCAMSGNLLYRLNLRLWNTIGLLYLWFYRPNSCNHYGSKADCNRNYFHPALCHWSLPAHCGGWKFDSSG